MGKKGKYEVDSSKIDHKKAASLIEEKLKAKIARSEKDFKRKGAKYDGVTDGYVATDIKSKKTHMVKKAQKESGGGNLLDDKRDLIIEYIAAPLAKRVLMDRAPDIGLVTGGKELERDKDLRRKPIHAESGTSYVALRSKFFDDFKTLNEFGSLALGIYPFEKVEGFERVLVGALIIGEFDFHKGNIGVVEYTKENGDKGYKAVKIDHGRSMVNVKKQIVKMKNYDDLINYMHSNLGYYYTDIHALIDEKRLSLAISEMTNISREEVEKLIRKQVYDLKDAGMKFDVVANHYGIKGASSPDILIEALTNNVMSNINSLLEIQQELIKRGVVNNKEVLSEDQESALKKGDKLRESNKSSRESSEEFSKKAALLHDLNDIFRPFVNFEMIDGELIRGDISKLSIEDKKLFKNSMKKIKVPVGLEGEVLWRNTKIDEDFLKNRNAVKNELHSLIYTRQRDSYNKEERKEFDSNENYIKEWDKRSFFGRFTEVFKLDPKSKGAMELMNAMSKIVRSNPKNAAKVQAFVEGIQKGMLSKKGVENGILELISESNLSVGAETEILQNLNKKLGLSINNKVELDQKSSEMGALIQFTTNVVGDNKALIEIASNFIEKLQAGKLSKKLIESNLQEIIDESKLSAGERKEMASSLGELNKKLGIKLKMPEASHVEGIAKQSENKDKHR